MSPRSSNQEAVLENLPCLKCENISRGENKSHSEASRKIVENSTESGKNEREVNSDQTDGKKELCIFSVACILSYVLYECPSTV